MKSLEASDASLLGLLWNEKGDGVISCGSDGVIRLWDLVKNETTDVLEGKFATRKYDLDLHYL